VPAWAVNHVRFAAPKLVDALLAAGDAIRSKKGDPRAAMQARRDAVAAVRREAEKALEAAGHAATPQTMQRVAATLEAVATYGHAKGRPVPGRLTEELTPPGFEELAEMGLLPTGGAAPPPMRLVPPSPVSKPAERSMPAKQAKPATAAVDRAAERRRAAEAAARARRELEARTKALEEARARLRAAEGALKAARRGREKLEKELERSSREERKAETAASAAREAAASAELAHGEARRAVEESARTSRR